MRVIVRGRLYRLPWSNAADWEVTSRNERAATVQVWSNSAQAGYIANETDLIEADRDMTSPMFLSPDEPLHGKLHGSSAAGLPPSGPAASSATAVPTPAVASSRLLPPVTVARPSSSPGMGGQPLARARHSDPASAHEAARRARRELTDNQRRVLIVHAQAGADGLSGDEMADKMGGEAQYALLGPRRPQLERAGFLEKAGLRPNRRNNPVQVYRCTPSGFALAQQWMEADRARSI